ncbi:MAG: glycosyl hydrolase 108 family protein [Byssovorax sp.]
MPASTTTNDQKDIATKGTLHVAQATAPDVCKVPSMQMAPMPFPNYVTSTKLTKGATTKSFIAGFPVWTSIGELGPPSEPAHIGTGGGVVSGTYRDVATPTSYSKDVFFEGNPVVRLNDTTNQNKANTVGIVVYGPSVGIFAKADDYDFQIALKRVLRYEGGLTDDPNDTGGRTMKGITHSEYDKYRDAHNLPRQDVAKISDAEVADIYKTKYWDAAGCNDLPPKTAMAHFDWAVNHGVTGAGQHFDGILGTQKGETTAAAMQRNLTNGTTEDQILDRYIGRREQFYRNLAAKKPKQRKFLKGWLNRARQLRDELGVPGAAPAIVSKPAGAAGGGRRRRTRATAKRTVKKKK